MALLPGATQEKYITRITTPRVGYAVQIPHPRVVGDVVRKNFVLVQCTEQERFAQAIAWRDATYRALYGGALPPERVFHRQQGNSNTGLPGISRVDKRQRKRRADGTVSHYVVPCIVALICTIPGHNYARARGYRSKIYSIKKYGEEEALRLAQAWRENMVEELARASA